MTHVRAMNDKLPSEQKRSSNHAARKRVQRGQAPGTSTPRIKVRCDARTIITIKPHMLAYWRQRYPNLCVIE